MKKKLILFLLCFSLIYGLVISEYIYVTKVQQHIIFPSLLLLSLFIPVWWTSYGETFRFRVKTPMVIYVMAGYVFLVTASLLQSDYSYYYNSVNVLKDLVKSILWCVTFYMGYKIGRTPSYRSFSIIPYLMLFGCIIVAFFYFRISLLHLHSGDMDYSDAVFPVVVFLPYIFLIRKNLLQLLGIVIIGIAVMYSFKRSIIIAYVGSILIFMLFQWTVRHRSLFKKLLIISSICIILYYGFNYIESQSGGYIIERFLNLELDGGSGRDDLYSALFQRILQNSDTELFWGNGYMSVMTVTGKLAHNDFLEVLYDFGVFAFSFFVGIHVCLMVYLLRFYRAREVLQEKTYIYFITYFNILCLGLFNCFITYTPVINASIFPLGLLIGHYHYCKSARYC